MIRTLTTESDKEKLTILYARLSHDDGNEGDSNSILNQKMMLEDFAKKSGFRNVKFLYDDGISGTTFDRPAFKEAIELVQAGKVANFVVKDLSRFGRDYLQVGMFTEAMFPEKDVRFIAINDNVDSLRGEDNSLAPFRNMFNEWYARDVSKKVRAVFKARGEAGKRLATCPPYGYIKNSDSEWIVDEEAAEVLRRIFREYLGGRSATQIAKELENDRILTPSGHFKALGIKTRANIKGINNYLWAYDAICYMLDNYVYCGHTVNFKFHKRSYKDHRTVVNPRESWKIFRDTHEAIIDEETFKMAQEIREKTRHRKTKRNQPGLFSGVLYCADCGRKHYYSGQTKCPYYSCSGEMAPQKWCSGGHGISEGALAKVVSESLREFVNFAKNDEEKLVKMLREKLELKIQKTGVNTLKELAQNRKRAAELDQIIAKLFESYAAGKLTESRFAKMSADYEAEQAEISRKIAEQEKSVAAKSESEKNVIDFVKMIRGLLDFMELTPEIVHEFLTKIEVGLVSREGKIRRQDVRLEYRYIGAVEAFAKSDK